MLWAPIKTLRGTPPPSLLQWAFGLYRGQGISAGEEFAGCQSGNLGRWWDKAESAYEMHST